MPPAILQQLDNFYLTESDLEDTPSRKDEVDAETEKRLRFYGCQRIQRAVVLLRVPQVVAATAQTLLHRFYCKKSLCLWHIRVRFECRRETALSRVALTRLNLLYLLVFWRGLVFLHDRRGGHQALAFQQSKVVQLARTCLQECCGVQKLTVAVTWIAIKIEEQTKLASLNDVTMVFHVLQQREDGKRRINIVTPDDAEFVKLKSEICARFEMGVFDAQGFICHVDHPHKLTPNIPGLIFYDKEMKRDEIPEGLLQVRFAHLSLCLNGCMVL